MKQTRALTEGALMSALFLVLLFISLFVPILGILTIWVLPLPFVIYTVRHGWRPGLIALVAVFALSFLLTGLLGFPLVLLFGVGGWVMGLIYHRRKGAFAVLLGGSLSYISTIILLFVGSILLLDIHPIQSMQDVMRQSIQTAEGTIRAIGQEPNEQLDLLLEVVQRLDQLTAVMFIIGGTSIAFISQLISQFMLKRLGEKPETFPPFRNWNLPKSLLWYYLIMVIIILFAEVEEGTALFIVISNLFPLLEMAMVIQGLTVIFYFCHVKKISKAVPVILVIAGLFIPFILYLVRILGIIDLGFHLKKRMESS